MTSLLRYIADVRPHEAALTLLMTAYFFVLLVTYYLLKPVRDSMFLVELGAEQLPIVFIMVAIVVAPVVRIHGYAARRLSTGALIGLVTLILAASLVALWAALESRSQWLFYLLYIWVSIYGALTASQFWLFANDLFTAAQGRRLFAVLNTGAMLGAFAGGEVAHLLVDVLGMRTQDLLLVTAGVLAGSLFVVWGALREADRSTVPLPPTSRDAIESPDDAGGASAGFLSMLGTVRRSWLLTFIVGIIALEMLTHTFVDYQFKALTAEAFPEESDLTSFLATFYGRVSLIALALQIFVVPRLLSRYGIGSALLMMPIALFAGSVFLLIVPGLWAVVFLRGADLSIEHSANKVGRELLFLPVPMKVKEKVKVFIDVFIDRGFRGLAGALLLLFTAVLGWGVIPLGIATLLFIVAWIVVALCARRSYTVAFQEALEAGQLEMATSWTRTASLDDTLQVLEHAVTNADDMRILYALRALEQHDVTTDASSRVDEAVRPLLRYPSAKVRMQAIKTIDHASSSFPDIDDRFLDDDRAIQEAAYRHQFDYDVPETEVLKAYLKKNGAATIDVADASCVVPLGSDGATACLDIEMIDALTTHDDPGLRAALAHVLREASPTVTEERLHTLANDDHASVRRAAIQSMGTTKALFTDTLIPALADDDVHVAAWNALASQGSRVLPALVDAFRAPDTTKHVRRRIPRVLSSIPDQRSVDVLRDRLQCDDPILRFNVTTALRRLNAEMDTCSLPDHELDEALNAEIEVYYRLTQVHHRIKQDGEPLADREDQILDLYDRGVLKPPFKLRSLATLLGERRERSAERIFQLLGLRYSQRTVRYAYNAFSSEQEDLRAMAAEWIDNVIDPSLRRRLRPIIDPPELYVQARAGERLLDITTETIEEALLALINSADSKLQAYAILLVPAVSTPRLVARARALIRIGGKRAQTAARYARALSDEHEDIYA
ncbi:MAG: Npt1/Npt2 family nucleotide transporter [Longimonas sp.]|uniref:Npt1/Npt2 family nucleotide transporter n=1 Tax=Longimonas sp. TaxID=2039626 RepID=UPI00334F8630